MNQYIINTLLKIAVWIRLNGLVAAIVGIIAAFSEDQKMAIIPMSLLLIYSITLFPVFLKFIPSKIARTIIICLYPVALFLALAFSTSYTENVFSIVIILNGLLIVIIIYRILRFIWNKISSHLPKTDKSKHSTLRTDKKQNKNNNSIFNQHVRQPATPLNNSIKTFAKTSPNNQKEQKEQKEQKKEQEQEQTVQKKKTKYFYCTYCGERATAISSLVSRACPRHPYGHDKGNHKLYEGGEKEVYYCKHCGQKFPLIKNMVTRLCPKHPNGSSKGYHEPAL